MNQEIKEVWNVEIDLAKKLLEVCKKHNLRVFADAGTLLGAVRHKGFIPWDDDMDFAMFREDYDKLVKIGDAEFKNPYFFQNYYSEDNYDRGHSQLRNSDTTAILDSEKGVTHNQGIFIDIFVLDGVPKSKILNVLHYYRIAIIKKIIRMYRKNKKIFFIEFGKQKWIKNLVENKKIFKILDDSLRKIKVKKVENVAPLNFVYETEKRIRKKEWYNKTIWIEFENIKLPAPLEYGKVLTQRYGNYMKPQKIITTHGNVKFNTKKAYKEIRNEINENILL